MRRIYRRFCRRAHAPRPPREGSPAVVPRRAPGCEALERRVFLAGTPAPQSLTTTFAVIGDYGFPNVPEEQVAAMVRGWDPDLILTVGDNDYPSGSAATIDYNIGRLYHDYIYNYHGVYGAGSPTRRFLPALGNHDWGEPVINPDGVVHYTNFFDLPGNERYYDFAAGPVHFFAIDSDENEPDGTSADSAQARWLKAGLAAATEPWKVVYFHHAPYSSGFHGGDPHMRWPMQGWGASAVLSGHDHSYERLNVNGLPYFVNGLGGGPRSPFNSRVSPFTEVKYNGGYGAMRVEATDATLRFEFVAVEDGRVVDSYTLGRPSGPGATPPAAPASLSAAGASDARVDLSWADNSGDETGFEIERSSDGGWRFDHLVTVDAGTTHYVDHAVAPNTTYQYRVRAVNAAGTSPFTEPARARTLASVTVVPAGSVWKYRDDGSDQGTAWQSPTFDDAAWADGAGQLGYGDNDEATPVAFGPSLERRFVTTYFRRAFEAAAPATLRLRVLADDGAVVYLNGGEVFRPNMPGGRVNFLTRAASGLRFFEETEWREVELPGSLPRPGRNVLAAEVHQYSTTQYAFDEPDMSFDLELIAGVDASPPAGAMAPPPPVVAGATGYEFDVTYSDDVGLRVPDEGARDLLVAGPNGFSERAVLLRSDVSADGRVAVVTYGVAAPGGAWDPDDAGVYTISASGDPAGVADSSGNPLPGGGLGSFAWSVTPAILWGRLFNDTDINARNNDNDLPLAGWRAYLDANSNATLDPGEWTATARANGVYAFSGLAPGAYTVRPVPVPGWKVTAAPPGGGYSAVLSAGDDTGGFDFGAARTGRISGFAVHDATGNGVVSADDPRVAGRAVYLDQNDNGRPDAGEPSAITGAGGAFTFSQLEPGAYLVREVLPPDWRPTIPVGSDVQVVRIGPGESATSIFLGGTPIVAAPGGPYAVDEGGSVAVSAAGSDAAGGMIRWYEWDFDYDGVTFTSDTPRVADPGALFSAASVDGTNGERTVAVRVTEAMGDSAIGVTTLRVANVAPAVVAGADAQLLLGQSFNLAGSFADPGPDAWTASVDWGDGAGARPLAVGADKRFATEKVYAESGSYTVTVTVRDDDGGVGVDTVLVRVAAPGVAGRYVFYNNSSFDGRDPAATVADDRAVAVDKRALLPGQVATFANVTSYPRGINGVMFDLARPPGSADVTAEDLLLDVGPGDDASVWMPAPAPASVSTRRGAGRDGADRVTLVWPGGAVRNQWLRVTVLANDHTALAANDVFYFGNLVGDAYAGDDASARTLTVNALDRTAVRRRMFTRALVITPADVNRDGRVNSFDLSICRANYLHSLPLLSAPPADVPAAPASPADAPALASGPTSFPKTTVRRTAALLGLATSATSILREP